MADFDPHAFVAGDDFDPHAFVGEQPPAPMHINREKLMALREKTRKAADEAPSHLSLDEAGSAFAGPGLSMADTATFGGLGALLRAMANKSPSGFERDVGGNALKSLDDYRTEHPVVSRYTDLPAFFMKPQQAVAETGAAAAARIPGIGASPVGRAILGSAATNAMGAGLNASFEGGGDRAVGDALLGGALGGAGVATPLAILAKTGGAAGRAIQRSKGGQAREFLNSRDVNVGPTTPGEGGPMRTMVTQGTSDADIGRQAEASAKTGLDMLGQEKKAILGILGRRIGAIEDSGGGATLRDVSGIVRQMREATAELDTAPHARGPLNDLITSITLKQGQHFNPDVDPYLLSETDVNKLRRQLDRFAKTGQSTDSALSPLKSAAHETRAMVGEGPFAQPNADYAEAARKYQESRGLLGINKRPKSPEETKTAVNTVKNLITRRGQNTVTAGGQTEDLEAFKSRHPEIGQELERPEILRRRADLAFHLLPQKHGGLIERTGDVLGSGVALEAAAHMLATGHLPPSWALSALIPALAVKNAPAITGRLLYGPALGMQAAEPLLLGAIPQTSEAGNREARR